MTAGGAGSKATAGTSNGYYERQWDEGVREVSRAFSLLGKPDLPRLGALCSRLASLKSALHALTRRVDPASHCTDCGGACCVAGKYHFTRADLLVYLKTDEPLFVPRFDNGLCPYLGPGACLMAPPFRPFTCITFNCELIEDRLAAEEVSRFYGLERELRDGYAELRALFPSGSLDGALLKGP